MGSSRSDPRRRSGGRRAAAFALGLVGSVVLALGVWSWETLDPVSVAQPTPATSAARPPVAAAPAAAPADRRTAVPPVSQAPTGAWAPGAPRALAAPTARIHARVLPIQTRGSALVPPADPDLLGWWSDGVRVGASHGTALLTGHAVSSGGGALDDVAALGPGDPLTVRTAGGTLTYRVQQVVTLDKDTLAEQAEELFRQHGPHRLALVTCADWDGSVYRSNTVVLAEPDLSSR